MKGLEKLVKDASVQLKTITDQAENKEKEEKKKRIEDYFSTLDFTICTLDKIFNPKWLNKTVKMESIMLEIEETTERISSEFATLRSMQNEDSETLQAFYLETLDLNATLQKGNQLKANRERIQALQEAEKVVPFNGEVMKQKVLVLCNLYEYWLETGVRDNRYEEQNWNCCKKYFKEIYKEIKDKINDQILADCYNEVMRNCYMGNKMAGIIPKIGFKEFIEKLDQES